MDWRWVLKTDCQRNYGRETVRWRVLTCRKEDAVGGPASSRAPGPVAQGRGGRLEDVARRQTGQISCVRRIRTLSIERAANST